MVPPNNFFIMDLIETFHISRKWAFFGLLSHAFFPLPIVFDAQASLKNQKMALLVVLRGSFLGVIGTLLF